MRSVNLNRVKASRHGALGSVGKGLDQALDLGHGQLLGRGVVVGKGDRAHADDVVGPAVGVLVGNGLVGGAAEPGCEGARLAAGVANLDANLGILAVRKVDDAPERRNLRVLPEAAVLGADAAARLNGRRLDKDEARAVQRQLAQVHQVVVGQVAVVGAVLAHGRYDDAVLLLQPADLDGLEERRRRAGLALVLDGADGGLLRGRVKGHAGRGLVDGAVRAHACGCCVLMLVFVS